MEFQSRLEATDCTMSVSQPDENDQMVKGSQDQNRTGSASFLVFSTTYFDCSLMLHGGAVLAVLPQVSRATAFLPVGHDPGR
jgi:hypothetical protein